MAHVNLTYKKLHEDFMANHTGTTLGENVLIVSILPLFIYFISYVRITLSIAKPLPAFLVDFSGLIVPVILTVTVLSDYVVAISIVSLTTVFLLVASTGRTDKKILMNEKNPLYITYLRSLVSIMTCLCILAVDFTVFPRRFAKTEESGFGLMDTGIGFYVLSNTVAVKLGAKITFWKTFIGSSPLLVLGVIRYLFVNHFNYQQHVSEYGVHWNFFFTLFFVKIFGTMLCSGAPRWIGVMALALPLIHQLVLSSGSQDWALSDITRDNFITANREGLLSVMGHLSLYLIGVSAKAYITKKGFKEKVVATFLAASLCLGLTVVLHPHIPTSRRFANLPYITWMVGLTLINLTIALFIDFNLRTINKGKPFCPGLIEAVNFNGLFFFLLSNLLTGLVNMTMETIHASPITSLLVITTYMFASCATLQALKHYNVKLKFW